MSASDWVKTLGQELENSLDGYKSPVKGVSHSEYVSLIKSGVEQAPIEKIFDISVVENSDEQSN